MIPTRGVLVDAAAVRDRRGERGSKCSSTTARWKPISEVGDVQTRQLTESGPKKPLSRLRSGPGPGVATENGRRRREYAPRVPIEQRRTELLDAALRIVVRDGHAAVTMEAVAAAAGVTKPVVYGVFPNRETLLGELLKREQAAALEQLVELLPTLRKGLEDGAHPADVLADSLDGFLAAVRDAPERWSCILLPMADMPPQFNAAREETRALVLTSAEELGRWITRTLGAPDDLDPELIAHTVVTLAEMAARLVLTDPEKYEPARFVKGLRAAVGLGR